MTNETTAVDGGFDHIAAPDPESESRPYPGSGEQHIPSTATSSDGFLMFDQHAQICQPTNNTSSPAFMDFYSCFFDYPIKSPATNPSPFTPIDEDFQFIDQDRVHLQLSKIDSAQTHNSLDCKHGKCLYDWLSS